jgi:hypothetical protein
VASRTEEEGKGLREFLRRFFRRAGAINPRPRPSHLQVIDGGKQEETPAT